jgi:hypothetical protein
LQGGLDGLACEFVSGSYGGGLDASEDLPVGRLGGGAFELPGEQEGLFEEKGLQGRFGLKAAGRHPWFLQKMPPDYTNHASSTRNNYCTQLL